MFITSRAGAEILSSKRGFADTGANYNNLQATGAGWYYTWGPGVGNPGNFDAKHYPMFWSAPSQNTINDVKSRNPEYVLGFNEPERPDQANMSVAQAISSWTTISNSFAGTSTKLVSPAVSDTSGGQAWLASFMQQATAAGLKVDAVAFHWYGVSNPNNPAGAASSFLSRGDDYHNRYNKPVFITEFAIHDWGGAYTDAEITEANRQFLNIVIPALESRSYVAGYAWYHWFSDARLYDGSPSTPTPMAYSYVGAVGAGQVANIGGQNLGEHVAYLAGGELTMSGATPGNIRYINALTSTNKISGTLDWGLSGSNWVRIQPDATLRKVGENEIAFSGGTITNHGVLEIEQGTLQLGSAVDGSGIARIKGGTLALTGLGSFNTAPLVDVAAGGTLDASNLGRGLIVYEQQTLENGRGGLVVGNVNATSGSTVSGGGTFTGNVTAQFGSLVRIGDDGSGDVRRFVIDDFETYAPGDVRATASPPWTAHQDTSLADIENYGGNRVLTFGWPNGIRGVSRELPETALIDNGEIATLFFRINSKTDDPDHSVGLADRASTSTGDFGDFEAQLRMKQGTTAGSFALDARHGSGFSATIASGLSLNTWYNIWMVVDQTNDTYDIYMNTGTNAATAGDRLNPSPFSFRNGTTSDLNTILGLSNTAPIDNGVRIDDFVFLSGVDLTNPVAGFDPGPVWTAETLTIEGNYTQSVGADLQLNLLDPDHHDVLRVAGQAAVAGRLDVTFAVGAPNPQAGDEFDILDFGSLTGIFQSVSLPALEAGLVWDNSRLLSEGVLQVAAGLRGDYNEDGQVDAADYVVWRNSAGQSGAGLAADGNADLHVDASDYAEWRANFGATLHGSGRNTTAALPEPSTALLAMLLASALAVPSACRRPSRKCRNPLSSFF